jgi:hypothetical protein
LPFRHAGSCNAEVPRIVILERVPACARLVVKMAGRLGVCAQV